MRWRSTVDVVFALLIPGAALTACDGNVHHPVGPMQATDSVQTVMSRAGILLTEDARVRVVEMSKDGSHVVVTVSEGADNSALAAAYEAQLGCPVRLETGGVVPATGK
ncbi:hypothetical protein AB0323_08775 [Arthrobacter sp. NPDC080031]|uniref:hypothetical protein n=1 Tax=Arthrobacter sp. NPDC080031 TaxID=3155918 RepID=UPI00345056F4